MKITPRQIQKIVDRAAECGDKCPEFLDLLCAIVKVEELNMALKRNQNYVMKMVMEKYNSVVSTMEASKETRYTTFLRTYLTVILFWGDKYTTFFWKTIWYGSETIPDSILTNLVLNNLKVIQILTGWIHK